VALKGLDEVPTTGRELMKYQVTVKLFLQLLFGNTSENYLALYDEGLLDDTFSYDFNLDRCFHFADIGGDTEQPEMLVER
ncbi:EF-P 5-aminopentanol modification-associated protein YfmH, partial [Enterococcus faecalis]